MNKTIITKQAILLMLSMCGNVATGTTSSTSSSTSSSTPPTPTKILHIPLGDKMTCISGPMIARLYLLPHITTPAIVGTLVGTFVACFIVSLVNIDLGVDLSYSGLQSALGLSLIMLIGIIIYLCIQLPIMHYIPFGKVAILILQIIGSIVTFCQEEYHPEDYADCPGQYKMKVVFIIVLAFVIMIPAFNYIVFYIWPYIAQLI